jgi:hypothetical protein
MVRDAEGQESESALEWGVDFNLEEGEELPADHEDLTDAQYTIFQMMQTLKGTFKEASTEVIRGDAPSGFVVPKGS